MMIGFLMAFIITDKAWKKFQTNPTITSLYLNENFESFDYPSMSVCPTRGASVEKVDELMKKTGIRNNKEIEELLHAIPNFTYGSKGLKAVILTDESSNDVYRLKNNDLRSLAFQLVQSCSEVFETCTFKGKVIDCCSAFLPLFSEHGFCFTFNSKVFATPNEEWVLKNYLIVFHLFLTNFLSYINTNILTVTEFESSELKFEVKVPTRLFLNSPEEFLHFEQEKVFQTQLSTTVHILLSMHNTVAQKPVKDLTIHQRKCIQGSEIKLKILKDHKYSYSVCSSDCKMELAQQVCGCLPPFHRIKSMNSTFCNIESLKCLKDEKILDLDKCKHCELLCDFTTFQVEKIDET